MRCRFDPDGRWVRRAPLAVLLLASSLRAGELAGHRLLVTSVRTGDTEVFIVDPETGDAFNVTKSPASEERYPAWSPDGRRIAFTSDRTGTPNLYVVNADGTGLRRLLETKAVCYMPSWAGERIVFGMHGERAEMASMREDGTDLRILGPGHDPVISPDGKAIAFTGDVAGGFSVFVMDPDGSNQRRIVPEVNPWGAVFPNWSPDSKQIVYSFKAGDSLELFVVGADGTGQRQLTRFGAGKIATPSAWSPDGRWISFRLTDERYWSDKERMARVYAEKPPDKRPVWVIRPDGTGAHVVECLRFQCAIDGSRASWRPRR